MLQVRKWSGHTAHLRNFSKQIKKLSLGQPKVKFFSAFCKATKTNFHAHTMRESQVIRSKICQNLSLGRNLSLGQTFLAAEYFFSSSIFY